MIYEETAKPSLESACFSVLNVGMSSKLIPNACITCAMSGLSPEIVDFIPVYWRTFTNFISSCSTIVSMVDTPETSINRCLICFS